MNNINDLTFITSSEIYKNPKYPVTKSQLFTRINNGNFIPHLKIAHTFVWLKEDIDTFFKSA